MNIEIIENKIFTTINKPGDDAITVFGPRAPELVPKVYKGWNTPINAPDKTRIKKCIINFSDVPSKNQDEAISGVCGANVEVFDSVIIGSIKALLCGNGDFTEEDKRNGEWRIDKCFMLNCGRRLPEVQSTKVTMTDSWIHNFGAAFDVRTFAAWVHSGGELTIKNCIFTQSSFFHSGIINFFKDMGNHIGEAFNELKTGETKLRDFVLMGACRGATSTKSGILNVDNCYKNKSWIFLENCKNYMSKQKAITIVKEIENSLHPKYIEHTNGKTLLKIFNDLH